MRSRADDGAGESVYSRPSPSSVVLRLHNANGDPSVKRAVSDAVMERAAVELKGRLRELASSLHPFPRFLSASDVQAVEVEPSGVPDPESGRIVVSRRRAV